MSTTDPRPSFAAEGGSRSTWGRLFTKGIRQHPTHNLLTGTTPQSVLQDSLQLDAIVVPASRTPADLDQALTLARAAGCWLIMLLCMGQLDAEAARECADSRFRSTTARSSPRTYLPVTRMNY